MPSTLNWLKLSRRLSDCPLWHTSGGQRRCSLAICITGIAITNLALDACDLAYEHRHNNGMPETHVPSLKEYPRQNWNKL